MGGRGGCKLDGVHTIRARQCGPELLTGSWHRKIPCVVGVQRLQLNTVVSVVGLGEGLLRHLCAADTVQLTLGHGALLPILVVVLAQVFFVGTRSDVGAAVFTGRS